MANDLADMMVNSALANAKDVSNPAESITRGADLAMKMEQIQQHRAQLEQAKAKAEFDKYEKVGSWFDTYSKMPEGGAKKAFANDFIPNGIKALGMGDKINPTVLKMMQADATLTSLLLADIRNGTLTPQILNSEEGVAQLAASSRYSQFGGAEAIKNSVDYGRGTLDAAYKERIEEDNKARNAAIGAGAKDTQRGVTNLGDLRKEVTGHPITKSTLSMAESYDKIRGTFGGKPSPAGDISGVFAYMKMLDPASTVREGEQAQARNAAGVPEQIQNMYNKLLKGETLSPTQRRDFLNQAEKMYRDQYNKQSALNKDFESVARSTGIDPKLIFAGTRFKAPPPEKKSGGKTYDVAGQKMSKEAAVRFFTEHPQFKPDEAMKKDLGL